MTFKKYFLYQLLLVVGSIYMSIIDVFRIIWFFGSGANQDIKNWPDHWQIWYYEKKLKKLKQIKNIEKQN